MAVLDDGRCMDNRVKQVDGLIKSTIGSFGGVTRRRKEDAEASSYVIQHISSARPSCPLQDFSLPTADWLSSLFALPSLHGFIWTCRLSLSLSLSPSLIEKIVDLGHCTHRRPDATSPKRIINRPRRVLYVNSPSFSCPLTFRGFMARKKWKWTIDLLFFLLLVDVDGKRIW